MFFHCLGYLVCITRSPIVRRRVCFRMDQVRKYSNRVVIDAIFPGKSLALFFDSDEMKEQVLSLASENLNRLFFRCSCANHRREAKSVQGHGSVWICGYWGQLKTSYIKYFIGGDCIM